MLKLRIVSPLVGMVLLTASGCKHSQQQEGTRVLADESAPAASFGDGGGQGAALNVSWIHGADCAANASKPYQVYAHDDDTYIIRQDKCLNYEAPFVYLLFGDDKVLMYDTGAIPDAGKKRMRVKVDSLITAWLAKKGKTSIQLVIAHTHGHGDHVAGDSQFAGRPNTTLVRAGTAAVSNFFGFSGWDGDAVTYELGNRTLDVLPIPGHMTDHIAVYDRKDGLLLTGDSVYPGHIFIQDWASYRASINRLAQFAADKTVNYVLGAHVEMTNKAGVAYDYGAMLQPEEHPLQLFKGHLDQLNQALIDIGADPQVKTLDDFIIEPH